LNHFRQYAIFLTATDEQLLAIGTAVEPDLCIL